MKSIKLVACLTVALGLMTTAALAQKLGKPPKPPRTNLIDKKGLRQGFWRTTLPDESGRTRNRWEGFFVNDVPIGVWVKKYDDGRIYEETVYYDTLFAKIQTNEFYKNGHLKSTGYEYAVPLPVTDTVYKYDEKTKTDKPIIITTRMEKMGRWSYFHNNGQLESEGYFKNDKPIGTWRYLDSTGGLLNVREF
ncbi:MAG: hypothetical protein H7Y31_11415 [Chitinophagaceae bacterium]|nr:hypothetical protein [Chitinophagaceae bacterium]